MLDKHHDYSDKFTESDGFRFAIAIYDLYTDDASDFYNRTTEEFANITLI